MKLGPPGGDAGNWSPESTEQAVLSARAPRTRGGAWRGRHWPWRGGVAPVFVVLVLLVVGMGGSQKTLRPTNSRALFGVPRAAATNLPFNPVGGDWLARAELGGFSSLARHKAHRRAPNPDLIDLDA